MACGNFDQKEDMYHFILHCPAYIKERKQITQLQQPYNKDETKILGTFLFENLLWIGRKKVYMNFGEEEIVC